VSTIAAIISHGTATVLRRPRIAARQFGQVFDKALVLAGGDR
jgi:hypothetical protein